jgi:hypothetical protein
MDATTETHIESRSMYTCRKHVSRVQNTPVRKRHSAMMRVTMFLIATLAFSGCEPERDPQIQDMTGGVAPGGGPKRVRYRAVTMTAWGRVTGKVDVDGDRPKDTTVTLTYDQKTCGDSLVDHTIEYDGGLVGAIVWLEDISTGKAIPMERRYEITNERCALIPRAQAVMMGGTLNIRSLDTAEHRTRLRLEPQRKPKRIVSLHMSGQVVPVEDVIAKPGRVIVTCDRHPWTRGWILVFDHPYFVQTAAKGEFVIDSVPPGHYRLIAWHERFGSVEQQIAVTANAETKAPLRFTAPK